MGTKYPTVCTVLVRNAKAGHGVRRNCLARPFGYIKHHLGGRAMRYFLVVPSTYIVFQADENECI